MDPFIIPTVLFVDDLKMHRIITNVSDCQRLQCDIDTAQNCCLDKSIRINILKTTVTSFTREITVLILITNYVRNYQHAASVLQILESC